jgi:lipid-A-disaccharide synthase
MSAHYFILSTSPGEISGWVKPVCHYLKKEAPDCKISLLLTPCQYSSGHEKEFDLKNCSIDDAYSPKETLNFLKSKQSHPQEGGIFCLGSDPLYALLLKLKLKLTAVAYTHHNALAPFIFKKVFTSKEYGQILGSMVALETSKLLTKSHSTEKGTSSHKNPVCLFMTSSRPAHFKALFPFTVETIKKIHEKNPNIICKVSISPLLPPEIYAPFKNDIESLTVIDPETRYEEMSHASLMLSLVGTNTLEAAYLSLPMIALVPLNNPEIIIFDGLLGLLAKLPLFRTFLPKLLVIAAKHKSGFYALPNRLLGKKVVPEVVDIIYSDTISDMIVTTLADKPLLTAMKAGLNEIPKDEECARSIVLEAIEIFESGHQNLK